MKRPRYTPVKHSSGRVIWLLLWENIEESKTALPADGDALKEAA